MVEIRKESFVDGEDVEMRVEIVFFFVIRVFCRIVIFMGK